MKKIIYSFVILVLLAGAALATKIGSTTTATLDAETGNTYIQVNTGLNMGIDGAGYDLYMYADTAGDYVLWDMSADSLLFVGSILGLDDDSDLKFGSDNDFVFDSDTAATLDITPLATDESPVINIGYATAGVDVNFASATGGDYVLWDASDEQLEFVGTKATFDTDSSAVFGTVDVNSTANGQIFFCRTGNEDLGIDLVTANTIGLFSTTGAVTLDFNDVDRLTDVESITFDNGIDINNAAASQFGIADSGLEDIVFDFATSNTVGVFSTTGVTTMDFNNIAINDVNIGTDYSFDTTVLDINTSAAVDINTWTNALGGDADATKAVRYWIPVIYKGTTYYVPAMTTQ